MKNVVRKLATELKYKGFNYRQVKREKNKAIYEQSSNGVVVAYEVMEVRLSNNWFDKERSRDEYFEKWPKDEDFGDFAWTYPSIELANKAYEELK